MNILTGLLRERILKEYILLTDALQICIENNNANADAIMSYSEYFFIAERLHICFSDYPEYIKINSNVSEYLLSLPNITENLASVYMNGFAGDCDLKSVEGIIKLMIFSYNRSRILKGKRDFISPEVPL